MRLPPTGHQPSISWSWIKIIIIIIKIIKIIIKTIKIIKSIIVIIIIIIIIITIIIIIWQFSEHISISHLAGKMGRMQTICSFRSHFNA